MIRIVEGPAARPAIAVGQAQIDANDGPNEELSNASVAADHESNSSSSASEGSDEGDIRYETSGQYFNHTLASGIAAHIEDKESDATEGDREEGDIALPNVPTREFLYPDNVLDLWASRFEGEQDT